MVRLKITYRRHAFKIYANIVSMFMLLLQGLLEILCMRLPSLTLNGVFHRIMKICCILLHVSRNIVCRICRPWNCILFLSA